MRHHLSGATGIILLSVMLFGGARTDGAAWRGRVPASWPATATAPVVIELPDRPAPAGRGDIQVSLRIEGADPIMVPAQYEPADEWSHRPASLWFLFEGSPDRAGKPVSVRIEPAASPTTPAYRGRWADPSMRITTRDDKPVLAYWHGAPAEGQKYPLNDFIHPLVGLDGEIITDLNPKDHIHHRGIFWPWVRNEVAGTSVGDWWIPNNIRLDAGTIRNVDGPVFSNFTARHTWLHGTRGEDPPVPFVEEQVHVRVFPTSATGRAIDLELCLLALEDEVGIGGQTALGKGYGGVSIRYNQAEDIRIVTDGVEQSKDLNAFPCRWADWSGRFQLKEGEFAQKPSGTAVMVHPSHPDYPPAWITRFYGFLNPSYPSLAMATLPTDRPRRLRYRLWVHRGDCQAGKVAEQFDAYTADWKWQPMDGQTDAQR